ncbi:hypothetical protein ANTRET_LOCUS5419 [Anthophora retusa]
MKTILAVGFLFLVTDIVRGEGDEEVLDAIKEHMDSCAKELQITEEEIAVFIKNENLDDEMKTKSGCYNACVLKHLNLLDDSGMKPGNFQSVAEEIYSYKPDIIPQKVEMMTQCSDKVKGTTDVCELAYEFIMCVKS